MNARTVTIVLVLSLLVSTVPVSATDLVRRDGGTRIPVDEQLTTPPDSVGACPTHASRLSAPHRSVAPS